MIEKTIFYCAVRKFQNIPNREFYDVSTIGTAEEAIDKVKQAVKRNEEQPVVRFTKIEIKEID